VIGSHPSLKDSMIKGNGFFIPTEIGDFHPTLIGDYRPTLTHKSIAKPCYGKGNYYFTIKNTTNRIIKVRYSIKGYRKFATSASLPKEKTMNADWYQYLGKVGPGIPLIKSVTSSNKDIDVDWYIKDNGVLYVYPYALEKDAETTLTVTLKNGGKKYKVKLLVKGYGDEEEEVDAEETLD